MARESNLQLAAPSIPDKPLAQIAPAAPGAVLASSWTRARVLPLLVVLVVAAALRLPAPDLTPFGHDEALEAARARPIWNGARPVDSEITSWWIPDPAGLLYFFALAEAFPKPAIARVELVAATNVLAVLVCYALAARFFGPRAAFGAGLLYAANPWAATFARQPWVIVQPLLAAVALFSATMVVARRERRWAIPFFVALAAQSQTHLLAVLYAPAVLLTLALHWRRWLGRELAIGVGLALLIVAPFTLHLWDIRADVLDALGRGNRGLTLEPSAVAARLTLWFVSGYELETKLGLSAPTLEALRGPLSVVAALSAALLVLGIVRAAAACRRRVPGWEAYAVLLVWFLAPLLLMSWQSSAVYIHYLLVLLPTPFLLMALAVRPSPHPSPSTPLPEAERGASPPSPPRGGAGGGVLWFLPLLAICVVQIAALGAFYAALDSSLAAPRTTLTPTEWQTALNQAELGGKQAGIGELHGLPLRYWQTVADGAKEAAAPLRGRDVVVVTGIPDSANRQLDKRRKALDYLLGPELEARFPLEGLTVLPSAADTLFITIPEQELPRADAREATRLGEVPLPGTNGATRLWLVRARPQEDQVQPRAPTPAPFETGVRLLGLDAPARAQPGQGLALVSYWLVERQIAPDDEDDEPFVELLGVAGEQLAYHAAGGLPSVQWRAGDVLVQRLSLIVPVDLPAGDYRLAAGLSSRQDGGRARALDRPEADSVPVTTIRVQ